MIHSRSTRYLISFYKSRAGVSLATNTLIRLWSETNHQPMRNLEDIQEMWSCCPLAPYFRTLCIVQAFNIHEEDSSFKLISSITSQVWHEDQGVVLETEVQNHEKILCFPARFRDRAIDLSSMSQFVFTLATMFLSLLIFAAPRFSSFSPIPLPQLNLKSGPLRK